LENKLSRALNNSTPAVRAETILTGSVTVFNVYASTDSDYLTNPYSQSGAPKYEWFGGDRLLNKIGRLRDWDSSIYRVFGSVNRTITRIRSTLQGIAMQIADLRYSILEFKSYLMSKLNALTDDVANILCSLDFLHDLISVVNGVVGNFFNQARGVVANLSGLVDDFNNVIAQAKATLGALLNVLGQFGRINMGVQCECVSFNLNFQLGANRRFAVDLADWLMNFPLEVNDPFTDLNALLRRYQDALTLDPKAGCPSSILSGLSSTDFATNLGPFYASGSVQFPPKF
jgi:uncharacterized protein YoxC